MKNNMISGYSRIFLLLSAVLLVGSVFVPIWRIELEAPQYPEGLVLQLYANKIGGDVAIINGLNHYIGMKTLHTENFIEFKFLTPILICFAVVALIVAWTANKRAVRMLFFSFLAFGILAAVDFYRWNYQYGHDLDPNAAIRVPGMAYQPPLLGYKQLLNFGAYSIPDTGGWLLIAAFALLLAAFLKETPVLRKFGKKTTLPILLLFVAASCVNYNQVPIKYNADTCNNCKMTISDEKFCAQAISTKGRAFKFDDIQCMVQFVDAQPDTKMAAYYVHSFTGGDVFLDADKAFFIKGGEIRTPMNGGMIAIPSRQEAQTLATEYDATVVSWKTILNQ